MKEYHYLRKIIERWQYTTKNRSYLKMAID